MFPNYLPRLPPDRQMEFHKDLMPGTTPLSKTLYQLVPIELIELMNQLQEFQEMLENVFMEPSLLP